MKKKRWKVKTHLCKVFQEFFHWEIGKTIKACVKCHRIQNWQDVYPVGR